VRSVWIILALAALLGCAGKGHEPFEIPKFKDEVTFVKDWKESIGEAQSINVDIRIAGDSVCSASHTKLVCFSGSDGKIIRQKEAKDHFSSALVNIESTSYVVSNSGFLQALNENFDSQWEVNVNDEVVSAPAVGSDSLYIRTVTGTIHAYSKLDGKKIWEFSAPPSPLVLRGQVGILVGPDGNLVAGFPGGYLYKFDSINGAVIWSEKVSSPTGDNELERVADVVGTPLMVGDTVCAASYQGRVACYKYDSGELTWSSNVSAVGSLDANGDSIFVTTSTSEVKAFSLDTGGLTWAMDSLKYRGLTGPKVLPGFVFVGDFEGNVFALDETDGRIVGSFDGGGGRVTRIDLNAFGTIFVQTSSGNFSAHSLSSGK